MDPDGHCYFLKSSDDHLSKLDNLRFITQSVQETPLLAILFYC
jgi:hypothetical protein